MILYILNLFDLIFTLHALSNGGVELNPAMQSIPFMVFYKVIPMALLCWFLAEHSRTGYRLCAAAYMALDLYHIYFIFGGYLWLLKL